MRIHKTLPRVAMTAAVVAMLFFNSFATDFKRQIPTNPDPRDAGKVIPFENYQDGFCRTFTHIVRNQLGRFITDLEESTPFSIDDLLQQPGCEQEGYNSDRVKSPVLHLTADDPWLRIEFLQLFHKYYNVKRKNNDLWLAAVNAKNTEGETMLDYFEHQQSKWYKDSESYKKAAQEIIDFACSKGAVYVKYNYKRCP